MIFGVVVINAVVGFIQESKAEAALEALRAMVRTEARVVRDGRAAVASDELVPGDLVRLEAGDKVPGRPAAARLAELQVDESALTGESVPVVKDEVVLPDATPVADRRNMLYSGTLVTTGSGDGDRGRDRSGDRARRDPPAGRGRGGAGHPTDPEAGRVQQDPDRRSSSRWPR